MKKVFFAAMLLLLSQFVFAQTERIKIINTSSCTTYVALRLGDASAPCSTTYTGSVIAVAPGAVLNYNYTTYPGVSSPAQFFNDAKVLNGNPAFCPTSAVDVGESCVPAPGSSATGQYNNGCTLCGQANLIWTPDPNPSGTSLLEITP